MLTRSKYFLFALLLTAALGTAACGTGDSGSVSSGDSQSIAEVAAERPGNLAPEISGVTFFHGDFSLDDHAGKPVLVNFWFPSCPPCRAEMPDLQAAYEQYGEQVAFIGVQQLGLDSAASGAEFVTELGLTYPSMADVGSTVQFGYEVFSFPTTVFLNKDHEIARTWTGIIGEEQIAEQLDALLAS